MPSLKPDILRSLHSIRNRCEPEDTRRKKRLLARCAECALTRPRPVLRYHETLLFLAAHPDDRELLGLVEAELGRIAEAAPGLADSRTGAKVLMNSGLPGSVVETKFSHDLTDWLAGSLSKGGDVDLAWDGDAASYYLEELLDAFVLPIEGVGFRGSRISARAWMRLVAQPPDDDDALLAWLLRTIRGFSADPKVRDHIHDALDMHLRWNLSRPELTRTLLRFPKRRIFFQRGSLKRSFSTRRILDKPLPPNRRLPPARARALIDQARAVLAVRDRETDPVTYADPREVMLFELDRGLDIALFTMVPERRLPLDCYVGYVACRNRVPIAYGGAWMFGDRAEVGIHLFDSFRGGESGYLFAQVLRVYRQRFRVNRLRIDPYQFGEGNEDAIRSGAFWFYHRLGFRPSDPTVRALSDEHAAILQADRSKRTPAGVLRRFTKSSLELNLPGHVPASEDLPEPSAIGIAVSRAIARRFGNDREATRRWAMKRMKRLLAPGRIEAWPEPERASFIRFCPLVAFLPGMDAWPRSDGQQLLRIMRLKGGPSERACHLALQRHSRLRTALREFVNEPAEDPKAE